jgi:thiaminase
METTLVQPKTDSELKLEVLQEKLNGLWENILENSPLIKHIMDGKIDKKLFALYMYETYHYTFHNARNQALVGVVGQELPIQYMKFCFEHAEEETGHELMALHDIRELGVDVENQAIPAPLINTELLIAYLYWVSAKGNPIQRLGYSFWAENCYGFINPVISMVAKTLGLKDTQLTFFVAHSNIDEEHALEVQHMILKFVKTDEDWLAIERVMTTTLKLQSKLLDGVFEEYKKLVKGEDSSYSFLNSLS